MNRLRKIRTPFASWGKSAVAGLFILCFFIVIALFAGAFAPYDPVARSGSPYEPPSANHLLGTNDIGQDILSEMIFGTRVSLLIGIASAFFSVAIGTILGMVAGYLRGWAETVIMAMTDIFMSIPGLTLTVVLIAYLGGGTANIIAIISLSSWAGTTRIVRARAMQVCALPFIQIEKTFGLSHAMILLRHLLPNIMDIVIIRYAMAVGSAMMTETSLSFLGLASYGNKSWGTVLRYAFFRNGLLRNYWWWYLPPIVCVSLCVLACTMLANRNKSRLNIQSVSGVEKGG